MFGIPVTYIPWEGEPEVVLDGTESAAEASAKVNKKLEEIKAEEFEYWDDDGTRSVPKKVRKQ